MTTKRKVSELSQLASKITKAEGGKSSVKIGDAREIVRLMVDMQAQAQIDIKAGVANVVTPVDIISRLALEAEAEVLRKQAAKNAKAKK